MILRARRYRDLVRRQLELFEHDEAALLGEARAAEAAWSAAGREQAEEAFGDWQHLAGEVSERLRDLRDAYAGTLTSAAAEDYRTAFDRAAARRLPGLSRGLGEEGG